MPFARLPGNHSPSKRLRSLASCSTPKSHTFGGEGREPENRAQHEHNQRRGRRCRRGAPHGPRAVCRRREGHPPLSLSAAIGLFCLTTASRPVENDDDGDVGGRAERATGACDRHCDRNRHRGRPSGQRVAWGAGSDGPPHSAAQKGRNPFIWSPARRTTPQLQNHHGCRHGAGGAGREPQRGTGAGCPATGPPGGTQSAM